ncbi:hypothetical protein LSUE1_G005690 [Lachnellula suecica]|uniref:Uncharacterized protein n=1 Tax=Lachnellula suecica TaxID=602035 RepID=A0A8T9BXG3_9HELO|nr:hypothetical protein LSUE1_G005690 [Lachnellula suecica]
MPRSATDATRFTSTTPHASAKRQPPSSSVPLNSNTQRKPGPTGETPQEKVRRLRAAADRARDAQVSTFDKVIVRGRVWADRAHRFVALSLIAATFVAGGVTVYALGDMMVHNRRKRAEFFQEQKAVQASAIANARKKINAGIATEEDINFIKMEDEHALQVEAARKEKESQKGLFSKGAAWLFSGLKKEEEGDDVGTSERRLGYEGLSEEDDSLGARESDIVRALEDKKMAIADKAKEAFDKEKERQRAGGPLDRLGTASNTDEDDKPKAGGWTSFMTRR